MEDLDIQPVGEYPDLPSCFWMPYNLQDIVSHCWSHNPPHTSDIWTGIT